MSSTNKTTNYELSQFIGADKPAWLSDYNTDMSKIDAGVYTAQTTATAADGKADTNTTNIGTLSNLTTTAKTNLVAAINEVDTNADAAQQSADNANTTAAGAATAVENLAKYLDLKNVNSNLTATAGAGTTVDASNTNIHSAYNDGGTLGKIWGLVRFTKTNNQQSTITLSDTGFRPTEAFTITDGMLISDTVSGLLFTTDLTVNTDGTASFIVPDWLNQTRPYSAINQPYMIIAKKFNA